MGALDGGQTLYSLYDLPPESPNNNDQLVALLPPHPNKHGLLTPQSSNCYKLSNQVTRFVFDDQ